MIRFFTPTKMILEDMAPALRFFMLAAAFGWVQEAGPTPDQRADESEMPTNVTTTATEVGTPSESGTAKLSVGDRAPDFAVEILGGKTQKLSELIKKTKSPTVLLFNRAHW